VDLLPKIKMTHRGEANEVTVCPKGKRHGQNAPKKETKSGTAKTE